MTVMGHSIGHGHMILATFAIEFDPDGEYVAITDGAPKTDVVGHHPDGRIRSELGQVASSEPGSAVSAAVLAAVSIALTDSDVLAGSQARLGVFSFKYLPASTEPGDPQ